MPRLLKHIQTLYMIGALRNWVLGTLTFPFPQPCMFDNICEHDIYHLYIENTTLVISTFLLRFLCIMGSIYDFRMPFGFQSVFVPL